MQLLNLGNYMPKLNHMKILAIIYIISTPLHVFGMEPDSMESPVWMWIVFTGLPGTPGQLIPFLKWTIDI